VAKTDEDYLPLLTAFVFHNSASIGANACLVVVDWEGSPIIGTTFSWAENNSQEYEWCRHPAVEITYTDDDTPPLLAIHVVWAEMVGEDEQWEIMYRYQEIDADDNDVNPAEFYRVTDDDTCNDYQPDLCVDHETGTLFVAYKSENISSGEAAIKVAQLEYDDTNRLYDGDDWEELDLVAAFDDDAKNFPSIDAGYFRPPGDNTSLAYQAAVVWSQEVPSDNYGDYHIFYNGWAVGSEPDDADAIKISTNDVYKAHDILPKIDVLPYTSGLNEAVITWNEHANSAPFSVAYIALVVTPYIGPEYDDIEYEFYVDEGFNGVLAPDIAGYEDENIADTGLFALSYYLGDFVKVATYSVIVIDAVDRFSFIEEQKTVRLEYPYWDDGTPFTGSSICLRSSDPFGWTLDYFTLAWVESDFTAYACRGNTD